MFTVQETGKIQVKIKNLTKSRITLGSDNIVGYIVPLMDFSGMCFVQNPIFDSDNVNFFDMEKLEGLKNCKKLRDGNSPCSHRPADSPDECLNCPLFHILAVCDKVIPTKGAGIVVGVLCMLDNYPELDFGKSRESFMKVFPHPKYLKPETEIVNRLVRIYNNQFICLNILNHTEEDLVINKKSLLATAQTFSLDKKIPVQRVVRFTQCDPTNIKPGKTELVNFRPALNMNKFFLDVSVAKFLILTSDNIGLSIAQTPVLVEPYGLLSVLITNTTSKPKIFKYLQLDAHFNAFNLEEMVVPNFLPVLPSQPKIEDGDIEYKIKNSYPLRNINKFGIKPGQVLSILTHIEGLPEFCKSLSVLGDSRFCEEKGLSLIPSRQHVFCSQFIFLTLKNTSDQQVNVNDEGVVLASGFPLPYRSKCLFTSVEVKVSTNVEIKPNEDLVLNCYASFSNEDENEELNSVVSVSKSTFEKLNIRSAMETLHYERDTDTTRIHLEVSNLRDTEIKLLSGETICTAFPMMTESFVQQILKISNFKYEGNNTEKSRPKTVDKKKLVNERQVVIGEPTPPTLENSEIKCLVCIRKTHCVKCTSCPLYPVYTLGDVQLLGSSGAVTVLVQAEFPPDVQPGYVQPFTSPQFSSTKIANKSLGISKQTVRKIFNSRYFFLTIFYSDMGDHYSGFHIKKGFHLADCQVRLKGAYLDSVRREINKKEIFPVFLLMTVSLNPGESKDVEFNLQNEQVRQNKENIHQLYRILDPEKTVLQISGRYCTSKGLR